MADGEREKTREELVVENLRLKKKVEEQEQDLKQQFFKICNSEKTAERYLQIIENLSKERR